MKTGRLKLPLLLLGSAALCALALLATARRTAGAEAAAIGVADAPMIQAADEIAAASHRMHRRRAALSMPYFSFAQSLRSGE
jgi:hypothetical protein